MSWHQQSAWECLSTSAGSVETGMQEPDLASQIACQIAYTDACNMGACSSIPID